MEVLTWITVFIYLSVKSVSSFDAVILYIHEERDNDMKNALKKAIDDVSKYHKVDVSMDDVIWKQVRGRSPKDILNTLCEALDEVLILEKMPLVLDGTEEGLASEIVKSFTAALHLPTIATSSGQMGEIKAWSLLAEDEDNYLIQISPPVDILTEAVRVLVNYQNMTNIAILFDELFISTPRMTSFLQTLTVRNAHRAISGDLRHNLKELINMEYNNFFILGRKRMVEDVFFKASNQNYLKKNNWFAAILDSDDATCECDGTLTLLRPEPEEDNRAQMEKIFLSDSRDDKFDIETAFYFDVFARAIYATQRLINEKSWPSYTTLSKCNDFEQGKLKPHVNLDLRNAFKESTDIPWLYAPLLIATNGKSYMTYKVIIEELTFSTKSDEAKIEELAQWRAGFGNQLVLTPGSQPLRDLTSRPKYRIVTNEQPPFVMKRMTSKGIEYYGLCIDLLQEIRSLMPFDYTLYESPDGKMGYLSDDGDWNGIVNELIEKKADIAIASISIMAERQRVIDFTIPYYDDVGISILMKRPQTPTSLFKFLTVLETDVWLCILAAYFLTSLLMWIFDRWSPYSYQNNKEKYKDDEEKRIFNFKECLWFCMTSLTPQGGGEAPKNLSGRLVAATWWLFGFIIMASYTANLAAFLTVSRLDAQIESLDDLTKQYKIQYAPINGSAEMLYFKRMADIENKFYEIWKDMSLNDSLTPVERSKLAVWDYPISDKFTKMWQTMSQTPYPNSVDEAVNRIRESKSASDGFALLGDATDNIYLSLTNCDLHVVGSEFSRKPYAIALQQGSPLREPFNDILQELYNKGRLTELKNLWWKRIATKDSCEILNEEADGISIKNIGGVFVVILVGIGLAIFTLCIEYFWYKCQLNIAIKNTIVHVEGWAEAEYPGNQNNNRTGENTGNRYLDPLNLYGDHFTRRNIGQRMGKKYPW